MHPTRWQCLDVDEHYGVDAPLIAEHRAVVAVHVAERLGFGVEVWTGEEGLDDGVECSIESRADGFGIDTSPAWT